MISLAAALLTVSLLSLPGWIIAMRARTSLGGTAAAGIGSLFLVLLLSALIAELAGRLPAWSILIVALAVSAGVYLSGRGERLHLPSVNPVQLIFPLFSAAIAFAAYSLAFQSGDDPLIYRAWYNADWFKHLGHVNAAANFGFPLGDIFGGLGRLHYYWLFYLLPGAGASLHGDAQGALIATTVIVVFLFWLLLHEVLKSCGLSDRGAALLSFAGWSINAVTSIGILISFRFDLRQLLDEKNIDPGMLMEVNSYIPQHAIALCGLLTFILLYVAPGTMRYRHILAFAPVVAVGVTSTLLGASIVAICCSALLLLPRLSWPRRTVQAVALGLLALAVVIGLQVVVPGGDQGSLGSPVFDTGGDPAPLGERIWGMVLHALATLSFALPLGLIGIVRTLRHGDRERYKLAITGGLVFAIALGATFAATLLLDDVRLANEIALRNRYLLVIGLLIGIALLLSALPRAGRDRRAITLALVAMVALSLPTVALNFLWLGWSGPRWQLQIPRDDIEAMAYLRAHSPSDAMVFQYPERVSYLLGGRDTWVPIFAGRAIPGSYRSTSWAVSAPIVARMARFYDGDPAIAPGPGIDWIYLSRTLHPQSYAALQARLERDPEWRARLVLPGASLFARERPADEQRREREQRVAAERDDTRRGGKE